MAVGLPLQYPQVTEEKSRTDSTKTKDNPDKANTKHSKTKIAWFSRFL